MFGSVGAVLRAYEGGIVRGVVRDSYVRGLWPSESVA